MGRTALSWQGFHFVFSERASFSWSIISCLYIDFYLFQQNTVEEMGKRIDLPGFAPNVLIHREISTGRLLRG